MFHYKYQIEALEDEIKFLKEQNNLLHNMVTHLSAQLIANKPVQPEPQTPAAQPKPIAKKSKKKKSKRGLISVMVRNALKERYKDGEFKYYPSDIARKLVREGAVKDLSVVSVTNAICNMRHKGEIKIVRVDGYRQIVKLV